MGLWKAAASLALIQTSVSTHVVPEPEMRDGFSLKSGSIICENKKKKNQKNQQTHKKQDLLLSAFPMGKMWQSVSCVQVRALRRTGKISSSLSSR